jgi:Uma2 family endonuclease
MSFVIADVAAYRETPRDEIPTSPPFLVIEVISPDDRHQELLIKLKQYRAWGIEHIWVLEAELQEFHVYSEDGLVWVDSFELPEFGFKVSAAELFAEATAR